MEQWQIWTLVAVIVALGAGLAVWLLFFNKKDDDGDDDGQGGTGFGGGGAPTFSPPSSGGGGGARGTMVELLSANTKVGCIGAFGLRYLVPEYDGAVVRVQTSASSNDTAKDFKPSSNGGLVSEDGQSLEDYLGTRGVGFVKTWYDQSINFQNEFKQKNQNNADSNGNSLPEIRKNEMIDRDGKRIQDGWVVVFRQGNNLQSGMTFPNDLDQVAMYVRARRESGSSGRIIRVGDAMGVSITGNKWAANYGAASFSTSVTASSVKEDFVEALDRVVLRARFWPANSGITDVSLHVNNQDKPEKNEKKIPVPKSGSVVLGGDGGVNTHISEVLFFRTHMQDSDLSTMMNV